MDIINQNLKRIRSLCYRYKVNRLFVFGSVLTDHFSSESDIDFVVDFSEIDIMDYADNYFTLKEELEKIVERDVDLLEEQAIRNPFLRKSIDSSKKLLYGQGYTDLAL